MGKAMTLTDLLKGLLIGFGIGFFIGCLIGFRVGRYREEWRELRLTDFLQLGTSGEGYVKYY